MAAIVRYVNVNSLAGGDGTTNATTGVNRAYSSQSEMEAAEQSDLVSSGDTFTGICSGGLDSSSVTYSGWLTSATNDILITTTTDRHAGVFDNTKYYIDTGTGTAAALSVGVNYINFAGIQFQRDGTITSGTIRYCINVSGVGVGKVTVTESIFKNISAHPGGSVAINIADSSPIYGIKNNIFYNFNVSGQAVAMTASTPEAYVYNNTFIDCIEGISSRATAKIRNNIFQDCASDIVGSQSAENDYNLTDNPSMDGVNSVVNSTMVFADKANDNFALVAGDTDAIGSGIGPASDAEVPISDIIGTSRTGTTTDIGAFMFVGGGGGVSITADSGTYSQTGTSTLLFASRALQSGSASYLQVGTTTPLRAELNILTTSGSYLLTGTNVNLRAAKKLITETGSYNLTGTDVTLIYTPGGAGEVLIIDSGVYSLAGDEVLLSAQLNIISNSGNYLLSGTETRIAYNANIVHEAGNYSLAGDNVNLFANYGMIVSSTSYTLTGTSVTLKYSGDTNQIIGTVTAGFAPDLYSAVYKPNTITVTFKE